MIHFDPPGDQSVHARMSYASTDTLTASQYLQCPASADKVGHEHMNALNVGTLRMFEIVLGQRCNRYDQAHDRA